MSEAGGTQKFRVLFKISKVPYVNHIIKIKDFDPIFHLLNELQNKPIFLFERFAYKLHVRKWYLLPLPLIISYLAISLIPNIVLGSDDDGRLFSRFPDYADNAISNYPWDYNSDWGIYAGSPIPPLTHWDHYHRLSHNITWFVLTVYTLYMVMIYKRRFFGIVSKFESSNQLKDATIIEKATSGFISRWAFVAFLIFFELLFYGWWNLYTIDEFFSPRKFYDVAGFFIAIVILPVGAEIFSSFVAGARLPRILSKGFEVNVFHPDGRGGLKPVASLLFVIAGIYFVGVFIVVLLYPPFFASSSGIPFILFGLLIFFLPQVFVHRMLLREKNSELEKIERRYVECLEQLKKKYSKNVEKTEGFVLNESDVSNLRHLRDEISSMKTWPFDPPIMRKYTLTLTPVVLETIGINFVGWEQLSKILPLFE